MKKSYSKKKGNFAGDISIIELPDRTILLKSPTNSMILFKMKVKTLFLTEELTKLFTVNCCFTKVKF